MTLRIAIAQPVMYWTGEENTQAVLDTIEAAAAAQVQICVFPELAVSGFHRRIAAVAKPELVAPWVASIQAACARHRIAAAVGAPTFGDGGLIFNSQLLIDEAGHIAAAVAKQGLTDPEATFFARGSERPVALLHGQRCTAIICREIEDGDEVCAQLAGQQLDIVFWPGLMGPEEGSEDVDPPVHVQRAQRLAVRLNAHVLQSNWPMSLNYPERGAKTGKSVAIQPSGEIALTLPQAQAGMAVFILGQSSFAWTPAAAPATA
jgi:omega-amidase